MATVTNLISGSQDSGTSLTVGGLSYQRDDVILGFVVTNGVVANISDSNGFVYDFTDQPFGLSNAWRSTYFWDYMTGSTGSASLTIQRNTSTACAFIVYRIRPASGKFMWLRTGNTFGGRSTSVDQSFFGYIGPTSLIFGGQAVANDNYFTDSDTTNGSWSSPFVVSTSSGTDRAIASQYKFTTAEGQQNYSGNFPGGLNEYWNVWLLTADEIGYPHWGMSAP